MTIKTQNQSVFKIVSLVIIAALGVWLIPRTVEKLSADYYTSGSNYNNPSSSQNGYSNSGNGNFSFTFNNSVCLGQTPSYTISAPGMANQVINWTSSHNGSIVVQTTLNLDSSGHWSSSGNTWGSGDEGQWTKMAVINGQSQVLSFNVQNCGTNTNGQNSGSSNDTYYPGINSPPFSNSSSYNTYYPGITTPANNPSYDTYYPGINVPASNPSYETYYPGINMPSSSTSNSGQSSYYDQNGYLCKPPGQWQ